jgi:hypothetical protein
MDEDLRKKIASLLVDLSLGKISITKTNYELMALIASYTEKAKDDVAKNALIIAECWIEEDGRPKHLIQDLWDVKDISVLDHIDEKYILKHKNLKEPTHE